MDVLFFLVTLIYGLELYSAISIMGNNNSRVQVLNKTNDSKKDMSNQQK